MSESLNVSLFQIPNFLREALIKKSAEASLNGNKVSMNTCILEALESYLSLPTDQQAEPKLIKDDLRRFTVRMEDDMKHRIITAAANWQIKTGSPVSMNAVLNTAILVYIQKPNFD